MRACLPHRHDARPITTAIGRRSVLGGLAALGAAGLSPRTFAQQSNPAPTAEAVAAALPVRTPGIEHVAMTVPAVSPVARFYSKLFDPDGLHKEQDGALRYYVWLGTGYIAIGARETPVAPFIDHFCTLVEGYDGAAMAARLAEEGLPQGRFGVFPDPDGLGLQLLPVPGGLATTTEPSTRIVDGDALVTPLGLDHMLLHVDDVETSAAFYQTFFDAPVERESASEAGPDRLWLTIEGTRLGLQQRAPLEPPRIDRFGVRVAAFDRAALETELRLIGATIAPDDPRDPSLLLLRDPNGLGVALRPV